MEGTWRSTNAGVWVEADSLLDTTSLAGLTNDIIALGGVDVPVTVASPSVMMSMTGADSGITALTMNTQLYNMAGGGDGIWAAIINGTYSTAPAARWTVTVANGADDATLTGTAWSAGQWAADVSGMVGGNTIRGRASGTYGDGEFQGAGTGTFEREG